MICFRRLLVVIGFLVSGLVGYALLTAVHTEHPLGFQIIKTTDADGKPIIVDVGYPTEAHPWPTTLSSVGLLDVARNAPVSGCDLHLVVISYRNSGGPASHLALALANDGYGSRSSDAQR